MNTTDEKGLCESCLHRAESIARVEKFIAEGRTGLICDPAPKAECKDHSGYGRKGTRTVCSDYDVKLSPPPHSVGNG